MQIRPVGFNPPEAVDYSGSVRSGNDSAALPSESLQLSGSGSVSLIISNNDAEKLEQLKAELLAKNADNRVTAELPLIHGFAIDLAQDGQAKAMSDLKKAEEDGFSVFVDQQMGIPEKEVSSLIEQFSAVMDGENVMLGVEKLHEQGITGKGTTICVIDTGVAPHPDLGDRLIAFKDFVWGREEPYDDAGHGTHCAGIAAGNGTSSDGKFIGVAPEANIVGVKVLNGGGQGTTSDIVKGIQWAVMHKNEYGIDVVNMSLGGPVRTSRFFDPITLAVEAASIAGLTMVVSAGNSGSDAGTVESPGNARRAITIGALDTNGTLTPEDDSVAYFSSRGPTRFDHLDKPDLVAPGVDINSLETGGIGYRKMSGTSMAAPFAAGVAALMKQVQPKARPSQIKAAMVQTADKLEWGGDQHVQGAGTIDPQESVAFIAKGK